MNWAEYVAKARAKGVLGRELFLVHSKPIVPLAILAEKLPDHLAYQMRMEAEGKLAFAGPLSDASGEAWSGEGLILYRAESLEQARHLAEADPFHQAGLRQFELRIWLLNEGSFSLGITLSQQKLRFS
jgi:uncharacterized protein YciI